MELLPVEETALEWVIIADSAQVIGNKLFLLGGGWDVLLVGQQFPVEQSLGIALSFRVPWQQTNQRHTAEIRIVPEHRQELLKVGAQLEVGRPIGIRPGQSQRVQMALNLLLSVTQGGIYEIVVSINGEEQPRRTTFTVITNPLATMSPQTAIASLPA